MNSSGHEKPLPQPDPDSQMFWEGCKQHKLLVQRCKKCGTHWFPPDSMCYMCQCRDYEWIEVEGKGEVYSWIVVYYSPHPAFSREVPYAVSYVELNAPKSIRMCGNIVNCKNEDIYAGMPVEVVFDDVTPEVTLPRWKPIN